MTDEIEQVEPHYQKQKGNKNGKGGKQNQGRRGATADEQKSKENWWKGMKDDSE